LKIAEQDGMTVLVVQFMHDVFEHRPELVPIRRRSVVVEEFIHGIGLLLAGFASLLCSIYP
jgi:hypothetical protein